MEVVETDSLPLPPESLLPLSTLREGLSHLLSNESWDVLTLKVVLARLEQDLLPQQPPGTLKPFKKGIKVEVDNLMQRMMTTPPANSPGAQHLGEEAEITAQQPLSTSQHSATSQPEEDSVDERQAPAAKRQRTAVDEGVRDQIDSVPEARAGDEQQPKSDAPHEGETQGATDEIDEDEEEEDEDDDPDAPRVIGKSTAKQDGKTFYRRMTKGDDELRIGQDVYLDTDGSEPYVARLQEIFVYDFAPNEVYFNARW